MISFFSRDKYHEILMETLGHRYEYIIHWQRGGRGDNFKRENYPNGDRERCQNLFGALLRPLGTPLSQSGEKSVWGYSLYYHNLLAMWTFPINYGSTASQVGVVPQHLG